MNKINQVTNDTRQRQTVPLDDGSTFEIAIYFMPMQYGWFIEELIYGDFKITCMRIVNSPNILHQFKNQLPFGLACISNEDREPALQDDFSSGASSLFVLSSTEVKEYEDYLSE